MANLGDIVVELTLDQTDFVRDLKKSTKNIGDFGREMGLTQRQLRRLNGGLQDFSDLSNDELAKLPDPLQRFGTEIRELNTDFKDLRKDGPTTFKELRKAIQGTITTAGKMNDITDAGRDAIDTLRNLADASREAQMASMGLNFDGTELLNPRDIKKSLKNFQKEVQFAMEELSVLKDSGNFAAYEQGLRNLEVETRAVQNAMRGANGDMKAMQNTLRNLGIASTDVANAQALAMERYRGSIMRSHQHLMEKSTEADSMFKMLDGTTFQNLQRSLLDIGDSLEMRARQGNAFQLALKQLGDDAPLKDLYKRVMDINKGLQRMTQLGMGMAWVNLGMLVGLVLMSNELDGRLIPAFENLKKTWGEGMTPFINAFTDFALAVMGVFQWLGDLNKSFAEAHPLLSQMFWGFVAITTALLLLLAPLAVAIGYAGGLKAAFALLWATIRPFVMGFLTVVPVAMAVAAAIVAVTAVISQMWKHSEKFRDAVKNSWQAIKNTIMVALSPIQAKWEELKAKFFDLIASVTGGEAKSMGEFWKWLGDKVGEFITWFTTNALPVIYGIASVFAVVVGAVMDAVIWLMGMFQTYWPLISAIVGGVFSNIKNVITSAMNIIKNVIDLVLNVLKGNWSGAWENIKNIFKNAVTLIWNLAQLWLYGKLLKVIGVVGKGLVSGLKGAWNLALTAIKNVLKLILSAGKVGFNAAKVAIVAIVADLTARVSSKYREIRDKAVSYINSLKSKAVSVFNSIKSAMQNPIEKAKTKILGIIDAIKNAFSKMKIKIPSFKIPKISVSVAWGGPGGKIPYPKFGVSWNAKGNIFNGATLLGGGQGVGEAGAEAVLPLEHRRYMKPFSSAIAAHLAKMTKSDESKGGSQYTINFNEPVVIREQSDINRIVDELEKRQRLIARSRGIFSHSN